MAIVLPAADKVLKIKSVKELKQSHHVPRMYDRAFTSKVLADDHMVIRALRDDVSTLYGYLSTVIDSHNILLTKVDNLEVAVADLTARIEALETTTT